MALVAGGEGHGQGDAPVGEELRPDDGRPGNGWAHLQQLRRSKPHDAGERGVLLIRESNGVGGVGVPREPQDDAMVARRERQCRGGAAALSAIDDDRRACGRTAHREARARHGRVGRARDGATSDEEAGDDPGERKREKQPEARVAQLIACWPFDGDGER